MVLLAWRSIGALGRDLDDVVLVQFRANQALDVMVEAQAAVARGANAVLNPFTDAAIRRSARTCIGAAWTRMDAAAKDFGALPHTAEVAARWKEVEAPWTAWRVAVGRLVDLSARGEELLERGAATTSVDAQRPGVYAEACSSFPPPEKALGAVIEVTRQVAARGAEAGRPPRGRLPAP